MSCNMGPGGKKEQADATQRKKRKKGESEGRGFLRGWRMEGGMWKKEELRKWDAVMKRETRICCVRVSPEASYRACVVLSAAVLSLEPGVPNRPATRSHPSPMLQWFSAKPMYVKTRVII